MQVIEGTAEIHGCTANVRWSEQAYGPTVNAPDLVTLVEGVAGQLVGAGRWQRLPEPTMAAEDFSFLAGGGLCLFLDHLHESDSLLIFTGMHVLMRKPQC